MDVNFVKKMSLVYAGYISNIFTPFPPFMPNTTKTNYQHPTKLKFTQQNQQGFPQNSELVAETDSKYKFREVRNGLTANIYPTREPPPSPPLPPP